MFEAIYTETGIGLAAVQIGKLLRIAVVDLMNKPTETKNIEDRKNPMVLINPVILETSKEQTEVEEGNLSIPNEKVFVRRPEKIRVEYLDIDGKKQQLKASGLLARCIQHEMEQMDGTVILDYKTICKK